MKKEALRNFKFRFHTQHIQVLIQRVVDPFITLNHQEG